MKVNKFIFQVDLVVLDLEEDKDAPLIISCPFLAIGQTLIDEAAGELITRVNDEQLVFNIFKVMKYPESIDDFSQLMSFKGCC